MVASEVSGVMFSVDPVTGAKDQIVIESVLGLGETIVQGAVIPDRYLIQKDSFIIFSREISDQQIMIVRQGSETKTVPVPKKQIGKPKLADSEIVILAKLAQKLQEHYFFPQDAEWAKGKGKLYLVQTRPVTTLKDIKGGLARGQKVKEKNTQTPILTGVPASPGVASGPVKILKSPKEIKKIQKGDILVAKMTSPDYVPAMKLAGAVVTNEGGLTSHAAIVSRELGIPCVVGTKEATQTLNGGLVVTVDGEIGEVYAGTKTIKKISAELSPSLLKLKTATKIYVNLAEPERAAEIARLPFSASVYFGPSS